MRSIRTRKSDAAYELNLAPFLDIIVSVIPMLLLSVAFIQIKMIETSVPQIVAQKIQEQNDDKKPEVHITLKVSKADGHTFVLSKSGKTQEFKVGTKAGKLDYPELTKTAESLKRENVDIFSIDLSPEGEVAYEEIVDTMDAIRRLPSSTAKLKIKDTKTGEMVETDLMFPDVTFANVVEK